MPIKVNKKAIKQRLRDISQEKVSRATRIVYNKVQENLSGNKTGRQYQVPGTSVTYTASAPGEPPASQTGELRDSINTSVETTATSTIGIVGSTSDIAPKLERGTLHMAPRPFLQPSFEDSISEIKGGD